MSGWRRAETRVDGSVDVEVAWLRPFWRMAAAFLRAWITGLRATVWRVDMVGSVAFGAGVGLGCLSVDIYVDWSKLYILVRLVSSEDE